MTDKTTKILVIGAGYAGMMASLRLAGKTDPKTVDISLINPSSVFVERVRLHEWATKQPSTNLPISRMLRGTRVKFLQATVTAIDGYQHSITVQNEAGAQDLVYDYLIYALGSTIEKDKVPGVRDSAYFLAQSGPRSTDSLRNKLPVVARDGGQLLVVGGGATGIEAAAQIKGAYSNLQVTLVTEGECGAFINKPVQRYMLDSLTRQGITIREHALVKAVSSQSILFADGTTLLHDICLWAGGFKGLPLASDAGFVLTEQGRILVDPFLRSINFPEVYVVGDSAAPAESVGAPARMSAFFAVATAAQVADNLSWLLQKKQQKPFGFSTMGQAIALGPNNAVGFPTFPNDKAVGPIFYGKLALTVRTFFVWFLTLALELERRWPGFFFWLGKGRHSRTSPATSLTANSKQGV